MAFNCQGYKTLDLEALSTKQKHLKPASVKRRAYTCYQAQALKLVPAYVCVIVYVCVCQVLVLFIVREQWGPNWHAPHKTLVGLVWYYNIHSPSCDKYSRCVRRCQRWAFHPVILADYNSSWKQAKCEVACCWSFVSLGFPCQLSADDEGCVTGSSLYSVFTLWQKYKFWSVSLENDVSTLPGWPFIATLYCILGW